MPLFLRSVRKFSFVNVDGSLRAKVLVYRARPILLLAGSWGRGIGKAREGLADVISIHDLLTNELLILYLSHPLTGMQKHHV